MGRFVYGGKAVILYVKQLLHVKSQYVSIPDH